MKTPPPPNLPLSVGCVALIRRDGKILLEQRSDSDRWAFIGGKMEDHEDAETALVREVKEETNLQVVQVKFLHVCSDPSRLIEYDDGRSKRVVSLLFEAEVRDFTPIACSEESRDLQFFTPEEIRQLPLAETHIPLLDYLSRS
ncbi:MAG: NUDIX domain-containing protein [Spirochaetales bacterium]|nr:NUDIX domain-containing protein [Spirochaetales bacterium]